MSASGGFPPLALHSWFWKQRFREGIVPLWWVRQTKECDQWPRWDSNPHVFLRSILSRVRLPFRHLACELLEYISNETRASRKVRLDPIESHVTF